MKTKFTLIALMAALAIPAVQAQSRIATKADADQQVRTTDRVVVAKPVQKTKAKVDVPEGMASITLTAGDIWEDGSGYQLLLDADATAFGTIIPESGPLNTAGDVDAAVYAEFEYKIPENADGSLTTNNIVYNSSVTILVPAGIYDYCITNPSPEDRVWITSNGGDFPGRGDDMEFKSGVAYEITIDLVGTNDGAFLTVDDPYAPTAPFDITVESITATSAVVAWDCNNVSEWNLRYRPYVDPTLGNRTWDFEEEQGESTAILPAGWTTIDSDGDGYAWYHLNGANFKTHSGTGHMTSASYMGGALTPDNWLISPEVALGGSLSFWACGQDASWAEEVFAVYVGTGDPTDVNSFVKISDDLTATGEMTEYTFDLSDYQGNGYIAIRHYNVTDMFRLNIDDVTVNIPGAVEPEEWTVVNGLTEMVYNIEGLTPETEYEVQLQSVVDERAPALRAPGDDPTAWTESVLFTTETQTGVETVKTAEGTSNVWYNLAGMKLNGQPTERGIYINNGKKVVIK